MRPLSFVAAAIVAVLPIGGSAQSIPVLEGLFKNLTHVDGYGWYGGFLPSSPVLTAGKPGAPPKARGLKGVGLEFTFEIAASGIDPKGHPAPAPLKNGVDTSRARQWVFELGLAYSQLSGFRSQDTTFDVRGSIREFPVVSWYAALHPDRPWSWYGGVHLGLVQFQSLTFYDDTGAVYASGGSTFEVGVSGGFAQTIYFKGRKSMAVFVEPGFTLRAFPSLDWSSQVKKIPKQFPRTLRFTGWGIAVGLEFEIPKSEQPSASTKSGDH